MEKKQPLAPDDHEWHDIDYRQLPSSVRQRIETLHPKQLVGSHFCYRLVPGQFGASRYQIRLRHHMPIQQGATSAKPATFAPVNRSTKGRMGSHRNRTNFGLKMAAFLFLVIIILLGVGVISLKTGSTVTAIKNEAANTASLLSNTRGEITNTQNESATTKDTLATTQNLLSSTRNELDLTKSAYCIGDSITHGYPTAGGYEVTLANLMDSGWIVVNKGVDGDITAGMLARFSTDVIAHDPDWVIIWGGINDIGAYNASTSSIESNLQSMYNLAHNAGIGVIAMTIPPSKRETNYGNYWTAAKQVKVDNVNYWIMHTAANVDYRIDIFSVLEDPFYPDADLPSYQCGDWVHLSQAGYDRVAELVFSEANW